MFVFLKLLRNFCLFLFLVDDEMKSETILASLLKLFLAPCFDVDDNLDSKTRFFLCCLMNLISETKLVSLLKTLPFSLYVNDERISETVGLFDKLVFYVSL